MDSILNWYREEGLIFKGGSGAGSEPVPDPFVARNCCPRGGTASGPVSFMRGADASPARSSPAAPPGARRRWSCSTSTTRTSRSSCRPRRARRTRSACCATPGSTWTSAARTSPACSTRTRTTRCGSPTSSCARSRTASEFGLRARMTGEVIETVDAKKLFDMIAQGRLGVRRPGDPVRRHDQRLAHLPGVGPDHRVQPVFPGRPARSSPTRAWCRSVTSSRRAARGETFDVYTNDVTNEDDPLPRVVATTPCGTWSPGPNRSSSCGSRTAPGCAARPTPDLDREPWVGSRGGADRGRQVVRSFDYAPGAHADPPCRRSPSRPRESRRGRALAAVPEKWTPELAHYLGWLLGDGCLT